MCWPMKTLARLTMQMAVVTYAFSKMVPCSARVSMFGVVITLLPVKPAASQRMSSRKKNTTFGLACAAPGAAIIRLASHERTGFPTGLNFMDDSVFVMTSTANGAGVRSFARRPGHRRDFLLGVAELVEIRG